MWCVGLIVPVCLCMRVFKCNQQLIMLIKSLQLPTKCLLNRYRIVRVEIFNRQTLASSPSPLKNNTKMNQYLKQGQPMLSTRSPTFRVTRLTAKKVTEISAHSKCMNFSLTFHFDFVNSMGNLIKMKITIFGAHFLGNCLWTWWLCGMRDTQTRTSKVRFSKLKSKSIVRMYN